MNISVRDSIGQTVFDESNSSFDVVCPDLAPPSITNLAPVNESTIGTLSVIEAEYTDASGIDTSSVTLRLDSSDVTSSAAVTPTGITYIPSSLADGYHEVYLEVRDSSPAQNKATVTWWFILDTTRPETTNLVPADDSVVGVKLPTIRASYQDESGIDLNSVLLRLDGLNVTSISSVNPDGIVFTPLLQLNEGQHSVFLRVGDNSEPINYDFTSWTFVVDVTPPIITNVLPLNRSFTTNNTPSIAALYSDSSGVDLTSIVFKIDGVDVSAFASANQTYISFTPTAPLNDGNHSVYIKIGDISNPENSKAVTWWFTIDTSPPLVTHQPVTSGNAGEDLAITAQASDENGIGSVTLHYRTSSGSFTPIPMTESSSGNYEGTIPASEVTGGSIQYYIEASDVLGNSVTKPLTDWEQSPYTIEISSTPWLLAFAPAIGRNHRSCCTNLRGPSQVKKRKGTRSGR
jgi:hypothetical protein